MMKFYIHTMGCKSNQFESSIIKENLIKNGFEEVKNYFSEIKDEEDLPWEVLEKSRLKGTKLLDEYLRYLHNQDTLMKKSIKNQREARDCAMGPMQNKKGAENPAIAEFLKGLWRK